MWKWGNLRHKLVDMLVIALSAIIIGENDFESMEDWGKEREEWFRGFLKLPNGDYGQRHVQTPV
jgi:hypothetical protein